MIWPKIATSSIGEAYPALVSFIGAPINTALIVEHRGIRCTWQRQRASDFSRSQAKTKAVESERRRREEQPGCASSLLRPG
ncbi:hypothetical protein ACWGS9_33185 [Bradyrhizobium sp. Arg314]